MAEKELRVRYVGDTSSVDKALRNIDRQHASFASRMQRTTGAVGRAMTRNVTLPIVGAGIAAVKFAADAAETENKLRVTFGNMADDIIAWSDTSLENMGLAQQSAQDMVTQFGLLFQAAKLPGPEVVKLSKDFTQLAGDMASFFNIPFEEALTVLRSGLVGETEPLRRFGVLLSESAVKAKAMELGIVRAGQELTEQQKVVARSAVIMDSLTKAQGDFVRTSGSVSNQARVAKESLKEVAASIGRELLPIARDVLQAVQELVTWFGNLSPETRSLTVKIALLAAALGPALRLMSGMIGVGIKLTKVFVGLRAAAAGAGLVSGVAGATGVASGIAATGGAAAAATAGVVAFGAAVVGVAAGLGALAIIGTGLGDLFSTSPDEAKIQRIEEWGEAFRKGEINITQLNNRVGGFNDMMEHAGVETRLTTAEVLKWNEADKEAMTRVQGLRRVLGGLNVTLTGSQRTTLENFLRTGDWTSALSLLEAQLRESMRGTKNMADSATRAAEASADADQKTRGFSDALAGIPPKVETRIVTPGMLEAIAHARLLNEYIDRANRTVYTNIVVNEQRRTFEGFAPATVPAVGRVERGATSVEVKGVRTRVDNLGQVVSDVMFQILDAERAYERRTG